MNVSEKDWRVFREHIAQWQEDYMDGLIKSYIALLNSDQDSSEKFWTLSKRLNLDRKKTGVLVDMRRSKLHENLLSLLREGAITEAELDLFSEELREEILFLYKGIY